MYRIGKDQIRMLGLGERPLPEGTVARYNGMRIAKIEPLGGDVFALDTEDYGRKIVDGYEWYDICAIEES